MKKATSRVLSLVLAGVLTVCGATAGVLNVPDAYAAEGTAGPFKDPVSGASAGVYQTVYFGADPADPGKGSAAWRVLAAEDGEVFLLSERIVKEYSTTKDNLFQYGAWVERSWLTGDYLNNFTGAEKNAVKIGRAHV
jgi:hypothetical protein